MDNTLSGIHHITAIAGDPQRNLDFYTGVLGLRLVKLTVNFDDPGTYHFYYGDGLGRPGTILTFFPFAGARPGRRGTGQLANTAFSVPADSLPYWAERLASHGVAVDRAAPRLGEEALSFADPDGLALELVATGGDDRPGWPEGAVPAKHAIRGLHGGTIWVADPAPSARLLIETLGFRLAGEEGARTRYAVGGGGPGAVIDIVSRPDLSPGVVSAGTVHHIAWRTPDDDQQRLWLAQLAGAGLHVTPVQDRQYFHSIYFREPGGVLYEIATDPPGFATDEPVDGLGAALKLPPWLESRRAAIERILPPLRLPAKPLGATHL
jgi:glyoxalase family protein